MLLGRSLQRSNLWVLSCTTLSIFSSVSGSLRSWRFMPVRSNASEENPVMSLDFLLGGLAASGLAAYLVLALLKPERF
jgi:K+-transporting ATPase KdpF subunit